MNSIHSVKRLSIAALLLVLLAGAGEAQNADWLALCSKCLNPSVTSKFGIGTAHAVAEARISRADAKGWCENWHPGSDIEACVREQLASEAGRKYRATADCTQGRITAVDGNTYTLAGIWDNSDIGGGRTKMARRLRENRRAGQCQRRAEHLPAVGSPVSGPAA